MNLIGERRLLVVVFYFSLLLDIVLTGSWQLTNDDCDSSIRSNKCADDLSHINFVLAIVCVGLIIIPMLFCCSKAKKGCSSDGPQISNEPLHFYDEINESVVALNKTSQTVELKRSNNDISGKCDRYQSEVGFHKKKETQASMSLSSPPEVEVPELPDREYLTDIDFVAQEFDLLLRRAPELPKRSEDLTNLLTSTMIDDKTANTTTRHSQVKAAKQHHETQQSLIQQEQVGMASNSTQPKVLEQNVMKGSKKLTSISKSQAKPEQLKYELPASRALMTHPATMKRGVTARGAESEFKYGAYSTHQQPVKLPTSMRSLPYRQPVRNEQLLPITKDQSWNTSPTYQNVTEESPTYYQNISEVNDRVDYQNVTGDVQVTLKDEINYQNIPAKQNQHIREETGTYQPLIFHHGGYHNGGDIEEDEYMDIDTVAV